MAHEIQIKELVNGIEITENLDGVIVVKLLSYNSRPFFRTTNETDEESYQVLETLGEIYHLPALATEFVLIDLEGNYWMPDNGIELIEYSYKIRAFRPENEFDRVLSLGTIETTANSLTVNIPGVGLTNSFLIDGSIYELYYPSLFNYAPIVGTSGEQKILILYAKPEDPILRLAQGAEALEAVEPNYDGLFVARIIVSAMGEVVEEEDLNYKVIASDAWRLVNITSNPYSIAMGTSYASSFEITSTIASPILGTLSSKFGRAFWSGAEFWILNNSGYDLTLQPTAFSDTENFKHITFATTTILKNGLWVKLKEKNGVLVVSKLVDLSPYALNADLDAEIVNRAIADANLQTQINTEHSTNVAQDASIADLNIHQITITATTSISTNTLGAITSGGTANLFQHGRNVKISNGVNAINLSCETSSASAFVASYTKLGSASITFTAGSGATLVQVDGTAILNGVVGSTACLTRSGNTFYLQISNR